MRFRQVFQVGLIASLLWLPLPSAQAHAELVSSDPAVGAHLDSLPARVAVTFDGALLLIGGSRTNVLMVKDPQGVQIDAQNSRVSGATLSVDVNPVSISGTFTVSWRVVSGDGHPEASPYQFSVGQSVVLVPTASPNVGPSESVKNPGDFWTRYGTRLMLLLTAAAAVGIWARFELARRKRG
jgi:methionine-rich copper-binding protein CopC